MKAVLVPVLALGMTLSGCSTLLRHGQGEAAGDYLNLREDTAYVYAITARHDQFDGQVIDIGTATEEVLELVREDGVVRAQVRMVQRFAIPELQFPQTEDTATIEDRGDAVVQVDLDGKETVVLKRPVQVGDAWASGGSETKVVGYEDVTTKYRPFKGTLRLETKFEGSATTTWLDRELGMVKFSMHDPMGMHLDYELVEIRKPAASAP